MITQFVPILSNKVQRELKSPSVSFVLETQDVECLSSVGTEIKLLQDVVVVVHVHQMSGHDSEDFQLVIVKLV